MRDADIRRSLRHEIHRRFEHDPDSLVLEELGLCQGIARIDLAVVNGALHGYEIKSEHDTLARLPAQQEVYNRSFDYVTVITADIHAEKVMTIVPAWWGIEVAHRIRRGRVRIDVLREAKRNPRVDALSLAQFLWRKEALEELEVRGLADGLRGKPRMDLWLRLSAELDLMELSAVVRERLKTRPDWRPDLGLPS